MPLREFQALSRAIEKELSRGGIIGQLRPGDSFQPIVAQVAQVRPGQFYWTSVGCPIVGQSIKEAIENVGAKGVDLLPALTFSTSIAANERATDLFATPVTAILPKGRWVESTEPLYVVLVSTESGLPKNSRVVGTCRTCGRVDIEHGDGPFVIERSTIPDADIFFIQGTSVPVVSDRVARSLRQFENVSLTQLATH